MDKRITLRTGEKEELWEMALDPSTATPPAPVQKKSVSKTLSRASSKKEASVQPKVVAEPLPEHIREEKTAPRKKVVSKALPPLAVAEEDAPLLSTEEGVRSLKMTENRVAPVVEMSQPVAKAVVPQAKEEESVPEAIVEKRVLPPVIEAPKSVLPVANLSLYADESGQKSAHAKDADALYRQGIATLRDLIAPPAIKMGPNSMQVGTVLARTYFVVAYPRFLSTNWFSPIINIDFSMDAALFIHPIDTAEIMKNLRKSATQVQSQIHIEAEDGKIRDPMLETALEDIEGLRDRLMQGTEKFFRFGIYMTVFGKDEADLTDKCNAISSILEAQLVYVKSAVLRMDQGFAATRPLGNDVLDVANNLNTEPLSTTFPFVSSDLSSNQGVLFGINRHNNGLILFDRFKMENANMVVFAKSGAGKSYTVKLEVLRSMMFGSSVIIIDPENEYKHLCEAVGGSFLNISLNSDAHLNPFDLPKRVDDEDTQGVFRSNIANLIGLLHIMLGSVTPEEDSILDRAIRETYAIRDITATSDFSQYTASSFPTMSDLYAVLQNMDGAESLSTRLERYTEGIFGGFLDKQTNIELNNQLVAFNIRDLEEELRPIAMYIILQFVWNEIRTRMKKRVIVVDEAWVMMQHEDAAGFLFGIAKRCRKYYTGLTTITQDISDFMSSRYGKPIITNSSLQLLLRQSPSSIDLIAETFFLTDHEKFLLLESNVGEGIFFAGTKHAAIKIIASYSEDQIITSDPKQLLEIEEAKRDFDSKN